jgi:protein-disulfide isomerase
MKMNRPILFTRRAALIGAAVAPFAASSVSATTTKLDPRIVLDDADAPILGNASGDLKIAVFFDYQCPFCRKSEPGLLQIVKDDGQIGLVMKDWPIFGEVSMRMAQLAWSAQRQGRYAELHEALMTTRGRPDQDQLEAIAAQAGLNLDRVKADMFKDHDTFATLIHRTNDQAMAFRFPGTPAYIVGRFVFPGVLDDGGFRQAISGARAAQK